MCFPFGSFQIRKGWVWGSNFSGVAGSGVYIGASNEVPAGSVLDGKIAPVVTQCARSRGLSSPTPEVWPRRSEGAPEAGGDDDPRASHNRQLVKHGWHTRGPGEREAHLKNGRRGSRAILSWSLGKQNKTLGASPSLRLAFPVLGRLRGPGLWTFGVASRPSVVPTFGGAFMWRHVPPATWQAAKLLLSPPQQHNVLLLLGPLLPQNQQWAKSSPIVKLKPQVRSKSVKW